MLSIALKQHQPHRRYQERAGLLSASSSSGSCFRTRGACALVPKSSCSSSTATGTICWRTPAGTWKRNRSGSSRSIGSSSGGGANSNHNANKASSFAASFLHRIRLSLQNPKWRRVAAAVRYTRIPVLVASVYTLGYQKGVMDCTKTPAQLSSQILNSVLASVGVTKAEDVDVISEENINFFSPSSHHQVAGVGHRIVCAARQYVRDELQSAMDAVRAELPVDIPAAAAVELCLQDERVRFWHDARLRLQGEEVRNRPWQYLIIESGSPNAFVTEILPQRFFITTQMLKIAENQHELAVVLGHEVSHLILGHVSDANMMETVLRTIEVLLLSLDPTSGALALLVIGSLATARKLVSAAHSRDNEYEADELGLRLAARACYDTEIGCHVIRKMHDFKVAAEPANVRDKTVRQGLMDTHPPTMDRFYKLQEASKAENYHKYENKQCATVSKRLANALWGSDISSNNSAASATTGTSPAGN